MNLRPIFGSLRRLAFRITRVCASAIPGGRIAAFGTGDDKIKSILVINLDRQPKRWRRVLGELGRFQTSEGVSLETITQRVAAVDARDGRAVAATVDVDRNYRMEDQLFVQPDARLEECFGVEQPIRMTRQEVAVARSHIEVWKAVVAGPHEYVLVLEDDIWFKRGSALAIARGWRAALKRYQFIGDPDLLYLSYEDAGGTAERSDCCDLLFRPIRGLWFLSGYVLSRKGAASLLRSMPVIGPVDTWINYRFEELEVLALSSPAILQRRDTVSGNSYSILPYMARAGIVDFDSCPMPSERASTGPVLAWTAGGKREGLSMALSILGLRVRTFDGDEGALQIDELSKLLEEFDALVDPPLAPGVLSAITVKKDSRFIVEANSVLLSKSNQELLPASQTAVLSHDTASWEMICRLLSVTVPIQAFPTGALREFRVFRDDRTSIAHSTAVFLSSTNRILDDSPWVLPLRNGWQPKPLNGRILPHAGEHIVLAPMTSPTDFFNVLVETFPGNLASFVREGLLYREDGARLTLSRTNTGTKQLRSGAFASSSSFEYGHFEAEIKAASGAGLITGFFLYRGSPRQEIDIELTGNHPRSMLVNVYFNPGDIGDDMDYGYRGSPCRIDLGFDATQDFHLYSIDWRPGRITWSVDGRIVHERASWSPTPIPYLPMHLHANLWAPRSEELAGRLDHNALPATAIFRNVSVRG